MVDTSPNDGATVLRRTVSKKDANVEPVEGRRVQIGNQNSKTHL
jgi:hypothetical protein